MVDIDAAIGFVVARGDAVDRARLSWLRTGTAPPPEVLDEGRGRADRRRRLAGLLGGDVPSVDATCFRLGELDDLGALGRPRRPAGAGLAGRHGSAPTACGRRTPPLAEVAPPWARPGDPEAQLYLTANAAFWLAVAGLGARSPGRGRPRRRARTPGWCRRAAQALAAALRPDGSWPSFLVTGWLARGAAPPRHGIYESAQIQVVLGRAGARDGRRPTPPGWPRRCAGSACPGEDWLLQAARDRLAETQRSDGGWESDDGDQFDVHTTLTAIRACLPARTPAG